MKVRTASVLILAGALLRGLPVQADGPQPIALVPQPLRMERKAGEFVLNKDTAILVERDSAEAANVGEQLAEQLNRATALGLAVWPFDVASRFGNAILLTTKKAGNALGPEGYLLEATPDGVVITAADGPGLFYGVQTLLQLLPPEIFSQ